MTDQSCRILVVDDDPLQRSVIEAYLSNFGYRVCTVSSGLDAINLCKIQTPKLILLDIVMPEIDGIETCKRLRLLPNLSGVPILVLTGVSEPDVINKAFDAGATDFLKKPINEILLKKRLESSIISSELDNRLRNKEVELLEARKIGKLGSIKINDYDLSIEIHTPIFQQLGFSTEHIKMNLTDFIQHVHPDDRTHVEYILNDALRNRTIYMLEYRFLDAYNKEHIINQQGEFFTNTDDTGYLIGTFQDVTEVRYAVESADYSRFYDTLTDLSNRQFFENQIKHSLAHPPEDSLFSVIFLGIDHFSKVNDELGHQGGDEVLKTVGERLLNFEKNGNIVSRFGGDIFALLINNLHHIDECSTILDKLLEAVREPIPVGNTHIHITASIGASVFPLESENRIHLLVGAESAMMMSQEEGGNQYTYRTYSMNIETQKKLRTLKEIRSALIKDEFLVFYQPQVDSKTLEIVGMEALIRWNHPERGMVYPGNLIPAAEESGLVVPIGKYVLEKACADTKRWLDKGFNLKVGVNIAAAQFSDDCFLEQLSEALEHSGLPSSHLEIEITESMAMKDYDKTVELLNVIRSMGIKTSMDDFGTGYSSLSLLQTIPLDTLKVDQAFVRCIKKTEKGQLCNQYENSAIASAVIAMSHSMGLRIIAEGVETNDQCLFLKEQKSELLQGYLFSKPVPASVFESLLKTKQFNLG